MYKSIKGQNAKAGRRTLAFLPGAREQCGIFTLKPWNSDFTHMLLMQENELPRKTQEAPPQQSELMGAAARLGRNTQVWPSVRHEGAAE